jgi:hypothetical protein
MSPIFLEPFNERTKEDERGVVWAVLIGVVLLAIGLAVGMGLYRTGKNAGQATATASSAGVSAGAATAGAAAAASAAPVSTAAMASGDVGDGAAIRVEGGVVKFYFASASAELAAGAAEALGEVVVAAGKKAVGVFTTRPVTRPGTRSSPSSARWPSAMRWVRSAEQTLKKPEVTTASGSNAESRCIWSDAAASLTPAHTTVGVRPCPSWPAPRRQAAHQLALLGLFAAPERPSAAVPRPAHGR